eukprot:3332511-Amphidinium_carterae.1
MINTTFQPELLWKVIVKKTTAIYFWGFGLYVGVPVELLSQGTSKGGWGVLCLKTARTKSAVRCAGYAKHEQHFLQIIQLTQESSP